MKPTFSLTAAILSVLGLAAADSDPPSNNCGVTTKAADIISGWEHTNNPAYWVLNGDSIPSCSYGDYLYRGKAANGQTVLIFCGQTGNLCCWKSLGKSVQGSRGEFSGSVWASC